MGRAANGDEEEIARKKGTYYLIEQLEREGVEINWGDVVERVSALSL